MSQSYRMQVAVWHDSLAPKDAAVIDPVFHDALSSNPQQLVDDLSSGVAALIPGSPQVRVRAYKLPGDNPNYAVAEKIRNTGTTPTSGCMREVALCLSFYSTRNIPRRRGRLFMPLYWLQGTSSITNRPAGALQTGMATQWTNLFKGLGGVDVDWGIWSTRDQAFHSATDYWVDDEWDVIRSRGLTPTSRIKGTTGEAGILSVQSLVPAPTVHDEGALVADAGGELAPADAA